SGSPKHVLPNFRLNQHSLALSLPLSPAARLLRETDLHPRPMESHGRDDHRRWLRLPVASGWHRATHWCLNGRPPEHKPEADRPIAAVLVLLWCATAPGEVSPPQRYTI